MDKIILVILVGLGSGLGAIIRHFYVELCKNHQPQVFRKYSITPITQINWIGSLIAGILFGASIQNPFITTGIIGGLTTFSTMAVEGYSSRNSYLYAMVMYGGGMFFAVIGVIVGRVYFHQ